jgi:hypothetical protein
MVYLVFIAYDRDCYVLYFVNFSIFYILSFHRNLVIFHKSLYSFSRFWGLQNLCSEFICKPMLIFFSVLNSTAGPPEQQRRPSGLFVRNILPRVPLTARTDAGSIQVYSWIFCPGNRWLLVQTQTFRYIAEYSAPDTVDCSYKHRLYLMFVKIFCKYIGKKSNKKL